MAVDDVWTTNPVQIGMDKQSIPTKEYAGSIEGMYDDALKKQGEAIDANIAAGKLDYQKQINEAPKTYDPMRNEAHTNDQMAQRTLRERMANMGMGAGGGKSMTLDNQRQSALLNRLGDISRQQQQFVDDANFGMSKLDAQGVSEKAAAAAQNTSERNQALITDKYNRQNFEYQKSRDTTSDAQWDKQFKYQQGRDTTSDGQWNQQFGLQSDQYNYSKGRDDVNDYLALYQNRKITKDQFFKFYNKYKENKKGVK